METVKKLFHVTLDIVGGLILVAIIGVLWYLTGTLITPLILLALIGLGYLVYRRSKRFAGIKLGVFTIWVFIAALVYIPSFCLTVLVWLVRAFNGHAQATDWIFVVSVPVAAVVMAFVWLFESKPYNVPTAKLASLTLLGFRLRIYLKEGNYYLNLENEIIGRTKKPVGTFGDEFGYLEAGVISFPLWDSAEKGPDGKPSTRIKINSRSGAAVTLAVTIQAKLKDPDSVITPSDAALFLGDSGRKALRHASVALNDMNISDTPGLLGNLMLNRPIVTARISNTFMQHREGSLLFDRGGKYYFEVVPEGADPDTVITAFKKKVSDNLARFDPAVLALAKDGDDLRVEVIETETQLPKTLDELGLEADVKDIMISDVELSETVQKAANKASAEPHEAASEQRTAESAAAVAETYKVAIRKSGRDAVMLGAAATGTAGITNFNIPGLADVLKSAVKVLGDKMKRT